MTKAALLTLIQPCVHVHIKYCSRITQILFSPSNWHRLFCGVCCRASSISRPTENNMWRMLNKKTVCLTAN